VAQTSHKAKQTSGFLGILQIPILLYEARLRDFHYKRTNRNGLCKISSFFGKLAYQKNHSPEMGKMKAFPVASILGFFTWVTS